MKRKENFQMPPGWPVRDGTFARRGKLGLAIMFLFCLTTPLSWAGDRPVENGQFFTTSNRAPEGMVINRIAKPPRPYYSPDLLSAKKPEGWVQPAAPVQALTPYSLNWNSFNSGGASFGTSATRHLGYTVGQSVAGAGASGSNQLGIGFWYGTGPACVVTCPPGGVAEGEGCYLPAADNFNGGCNSAPPVFSSINCGDTICGTAEAESGTRDTDWYRHSYTSDTIVTWKVVAEFPVLIAIIDITAGCAFSVLAITTGNACDTVQLTADLSAGTYAFFVATSDFDGYACVDGPHDYVAWLECQPNCATCPPGGIPEGEGCAQVTDNFNGGCNSGPPVYSPINVGDTVCGLTWQDTLIRDTDWYQKVLADTTVVRWCAVGEFPLIMGTIDGNSGCPVFSFRKFDLADSCDTATVIDTLPPGTWWFFVAGVDFAGYPCATGPHKYTAWLVENCANIKGDLNGDAGYTSADVVLETNCAFLFGSGIPSCDLCFTDVNCDASLTSADVVLEINRAFLGLTVPPWCGF
jgi:hypothetical protein